MKNLYSSRKYNIGVLFVLVVAVYIIRLFYLQVIDDSSRLSAENNVFRYITQYPARGLVYDRNGALLVYNEVAYDLMVVPKQTKEFDTLKLCSILDISRVQIVDALKKAHIYSVHKPSIIVKQITAEKYAILEEMLFKFPGFYVQTRTIRKYPVRIAAHVLGYVSEVDTSIIKKDKYYKTGDYIGFSGLEKSYEHDLRGKKGMKIYLVDVHNQIKGSYKDGAFDTAAVVGPNITTTLDTSLQAYGERLMVNKMGSVVAIEPATGEILAMVTSPNYDPNILLGSERGVNYVKLQRDPLKPLFNRAVMARYPPGSTFKMANALIGLQEGVITTSSVFVCARGYHIGSFTQGCHHSGSIDFERSIAGSCNAYYCNVYQRILDDKKFKKVSLAYENWRKHLASFGIGIKLETDLASELKGSVPSPAYYDKVYGKDKWKSLWLISMAIGQGELGVTPIQMANYCAILANRGYYIIPHIVKAIQGQTHKNPKYTEKHYTTIERKWYDPVIDAMEQVILSGTGTIAMVPGIQMCGKTGTAQNPHGKDHSIFIAFAPKDNPKIAIAVYVENAGFGSTYAAPIASLLIEKYLKGTVNRPELEKRIRGDVMLKETAPKKPQ